MKYKVTFTQEWEYEVAAEDERDAEDKAYALFATEMRIAIADTHIDDVIIEELEDEEDTP